MSTDLDLNAVYVLRSLADRAALADVDVVRQQLTTPKSDADGFVASLGKSSSIRPDSVPSAEIDSIIDAFYRTKSMNDLLAAVDWFKRDGARAYKALSLYHWESFSSTIRSDLETKFERIKETSFEPLGGTIWF